MESFNLVRIAMAELAVCLVPANFLPLPLFAELLLDLAMLLKLALELLLLAPTMLSNPKELDVELSSVLAMFRFRRAALETVSNASLLLPFPLFLL